VCIFCFVLFFQNSGKKKFAESHKIIVFYRIMFVSNKAVIHQYQRHYSILLQTYNETSEPKSVNSLLH